MSASAFHIVSETVNFSAAETELIATEWQATVDRTPEHVRHTLAGVIERDLDRLVTCYGHRAETDPEAAQFIRTEESKREVSQTARRWLIQLLCDESTPIEVRIAEQRLAGETLAQINYPIQAVSRGARRLRAWILAGLEGSALTSAELLQAASYVSDLLDISIELRNASYLKDSARQSRIDEAYRMHSLGQNIAMERERQRAALMEWGHGLMVDLHRAGLAQLPRLGQSDFGLWLSHKAATLFEGAAELALITETMRRIDDEVLTRLDPPAPQSEIVGSLVEKLQTDLAAIKFNLNGLFEKHIEIENGRDTLTRLLNRRFLSTVLAREIALNRRESDATLSVLLLDIDHFKRINDEHGHDAGDAVLQQAATLVLASVRPSDFVFRYGGEEILVVLVESGVAIAAQAAENLRSRFDSTRFTLPNGSQVQATVSIGVAEQQGRPGYQSLLDSADEALYRAKNGGRNRVEIA
jgi:diguanylate cyclase